MVKKFIKVCKLCRNSFEHESKNKIYCENCTILRGCNSSRKYYYTHRDKCLTKGDKEYHNRFMSEWKKKNKKKVNAHNLVSRNILKGKIPKPTLLKCFICGLKAKEYHHEDYNVPNFVLPVCKKCHIEVHRMFTEGLKS